MKMIKHQLTLELKMIIILQILIKQTTNKKRRRIRKNDNIAV